MPVDAATWPGRHDADQSPGRPVYLVPARAGRHQPPPATPEQRAAVPGFCAPPRAGRSGLALWRGTDNVQADSRLPADPAGLRPVKQSG